MRTSGPKVSCLAVTDDRVTLLKQAIACYRDQSWPDRELVIVTAGAERQRDAIARHLKSLDCDDIRLVALDEPGASLGRLRNAAVASARGEIVCQWDDDDLCHPRRIELQYRAMAEAGGVGCYLTEHLHFFVTARLLVPIAWSSAGGPGGTEGTLACSMMALRSAAGAYPETGPDSLSGEDNRFREGLAERGRVALLSGHPELYVYRYHGRNTTPAAHHQRIAAGCSTWDAGAAQARAALAYFRFPRPYRIVSGQGGGFVAAARPDRQREG